MARHTKKKYYNPDYLHGYVDGLHSASKKVYELTGDGNVVMALDKLIDNAKSGKGIKEWS